ncbi:MAG: alpha/beta hydrolase [Alphaproteobacteria bacterium]
MPEFFDRPDGARIAYHKTKGKGPCVVFLPGFRSDMKGDKALTLEAMCQARGHAFLRFDYTGHGESSGEFAEGTIGEWSRDAIAAIEALTEGPLLLVGSSMGGWIMLLAALEMRERIAGLVGIAAAPDFTEALMWANMSDEQRTEIIDNGVIYQPSDYDPEPTPITMRMIEDGRKHLLLEGPITLDCPVRLIHGQRDYDVPWEWSERIADAISSEDVEVTFVKAGDHRLSEPNDLRRLTRVVGGLLDEIAAA